MQLDPQGNHEVFASLKKLSAELPFPLFWVDNRGTILGSNALGLDYYEFAADDFLVGKTLFDLYPGRIADHIITHNNAVIKSGEILSQVESYVDGEGRYWSFNAMKIPLKNSTGDIVGIVIALN